ncbi:MAG: hypothetical protein V1792_14460 [Pseudomonadota bacterium]
MKRILVLLAFVFVCGYCGGLNPAFGAAPIIPDVCPECKVPLQGTTAIRPESQESQKEPREVQTLLQGLPKCLVPGRIS